VLEGTHRLVDFDAVALGLIAVRGRGKCLVPDALSRVDRLMGVDKSVNNHSFSLQRAARTLRSNQRMV
jgi:hypothetical protein